MCVVLMIDYLVFVFDNGKNCWLYNNVKVHRKYKTPDLQFCVVLVLLALGSVRYRDTARFKN